MIRGPLRSTTAVNLRMSSELRLDSDPVTSSPQLAPRTPGQALVEFALVLTALLFLVVATVDIGRLFYEYEAMVAGTDAASIWMEDNRRFKSTLYNCSEPAATNGAKEVARDHSGGVVATTEVSADWGSFSGIPPTWTSEGTTGAWTSDKEYRVTINHPFTPLTPLAEGLINATAGQLTMTYSAYGKHRTASTTCS